MAFTVIIPARMKSTRLPEKPLKLIEGVPMVVRVAETAARSNASRVVVATDDERILEACRAAGVEALLTRADHPTGTDRLAEAVEALGLADDEVVVNVQGDEPLIDPQIIDDLAQVFVDDKNLQMATVKTPMLEEEKNKPSNVKVITDKNDFALYFSRSLIPYPRENTGVTVYKHIGIYGYRRDFLLQYAKMQPTPLEQTESLEQLRALENGYKIKVITTNKHFVGVDTPEDLAEVNKIYQQLNL